LDIRGGPEDAVSWDSPEKIKLTIGSFNFTKETPAYEISMRLLGHRKKVSRVTLTKELESCFSDPGANISPFVACEYAIYSIIANDKKGLDVLMKKGYGMNFSWMFRLTPFLVSCFWGRPEIAKTLLDVGVRKGCRTIHGLGGAHLAALSGNEEMINLALKEGLSTENVRGFAFADFIEAGKKTVAFPQSSCRCFVD